MGVLEGMEDIASEKPWKGAPHTCVVVNTSQTLREDQESAARSAKAMPEHERNKYQGWTKTRDSEEILG